MKFTASLLAAVFATAALAAPAADLAKRAGPYKIRGVSSPVYHLYLQANSSGAPILGAEATGADFTISGTIQDTASKKYLNVGTATTSYKPVTFDTAATTTAWGLEGDTIITTQASTWGRQLNFLACETTTSGVYKLYLQTGGDMPSGETCTYQTLHLPCLC
ncbi:hypothetical protein EDC01DRAFT_787967 [Geopyxis carbonaria]|nr:hypothetical protein EDC01DRAFT_787967 [Geopyxis carbonaria]